MPTELKALVLGYIADYGWLGYVAVLLYGGFKVPDVISREMTIMELVKMIVIALIVVLSCCLASAGCNNEDTHRKRHLAKVYVRRTVST